MSASSDERTGNVLGALALAITDRVRAAVAELGDQAASDAIALNALFHFLDRPRIDLLADVVGRTSSATVRIVDRLQEAGLVRRSAGADARETTITITAAGRRLAQKATAARRAVFDEALASLSPAERDRFGDLAGRVIASLVSTRGPNGWMCRQCDTTACGRPHGMCPAANAAAAVYGPVTG